MGKMTVYSIHAVSSTTLPERQKIREALPVMLSAELLFLKFMNLQMFITVTISIGWLMTSLRPPV